jgi:H+/Cl- antiporter ClcA
LLNSQSFRALGNRRPLLEETCMKKTLTTLLAAATVAATLAASASDASARGGALAAGLFGGLVAGAIIGGAIASRPGPGYVVYPGYAAPVNGPGCYWTRMPVYDAYGNVVGWRGRPIQVCQ